jgi:hypothetical protein
VGTEPVFYGSKACSVNAQSPWSANVSMLNYSLNYLLWPFWAPCIAGLLFLAALGALYWIAWVRPAIRSFAKFSPAAWKTFAVSVAGLVVLILVWAWVSASR